MPYPSKPATGTPLNTGHALASGLLALFTLSEGTGTSIANSVDGSAGTTGGTWGTGVNGTELTIASQSAKCVLSSSKTVAGLTNFTIALICAGGTLNGNPLYVEQPSSGNDIVKLQTNDGNAVGTGTLQLVYRDDAGTLNRGLSGTTNICVAGTYHLVGISKSGTSVQFYGDGLPERTPFTLTATNTLTASFPTWVGAYIGDPSSSYGGKVVYVATWNRALSDAEWAALQVDPYAMLRSSIAIYPSTISAGFTGPIPLTVVGTNTSWGGGTTLSVSGVAGVSKVAQNINSATLAGLTITEGATTGTLTVSDGSTSGTVTIQSAPSTSVSPGVLWDGTAGSGYGGSPPTESSTVHGSGFAGKVICALDEPWDTGEWLTASTTLTLLVEHGDPSWLASATAYLEGSTVALDLTRRVKSATTGAVGYAFTLPVASFAQDGDVTGYVKVVPVNGYERLLTFNFTCNGKGTITRAVRYIDPVNGSDSNNGQSQGAAWKTINKAMNAVGSGGAADGAIVNIIGSGVTCIEDSNSNAAPNNNTRQITFRPLTGVLGDVTISRTAAGSPAGFWRLWVKYARFESLVFNTQKLQEFYYSSTGRYRFASCTLSDPNGAQGPLPQQYQDSDLSGDNTLFRTADGARWYLTDCTVSNYLAAGAVMYRNCPVTYSADAVFIENTFNNNLVNIKSTFYKPGDFQVRKHVEPYILVATKNFAAGSTTLTFSGSPTLTSLASGEMLTFDSGALQGQVFTVTSVTPGSFTIVVTGDASGCAVGDHARAYAVFHSDTFQINDPTNNGAIATSRVYDNYLTSQCVFQGPDFQPQFFQAGWFAGPGTISTTAAAATTSADHGAIVGQFVRLTNGTQSGQYRRITAVGSSTTLTLESAFSANQSGKTYDVVNTAGNIGFQAVAYNDTAGAPTSAPAQVQQGIFHVVNRQIAVVGKDYDLRNVDPGPFGLSAVVYRDSIFYTLVPDGSYPDASLGMVTDNNWFLSGTARGTNTGGPGTAFLSGYRPTAQSTSLNKLPAGYAWTFPYDVGGAALLLDGTDYIGAATTAAAGGGGSGGMSAMDLDMLTDGEMIGIF